MGAGAMPALGLAGSPYTPPSGFFLSFPGFGGSVAFLAASAARSASICALDRLGLRTRPSRLNRAQWFSMASVRFGFFELAIF